MNLPFVTDSHCHLDFPDFNKNLEETIEKALKSGVGRMVTICTKLSEEPKVRQIAERFGCVFYAAGTHPMNAHDQPLVDISNLLKLANHPKFVGIGETGLDYFYTKETEKDQKVSLFRHIEAAQKSNLPLIIHSRSADEDIADILESEFKNAEFKCVMHCFSSGRNLAKRMLNLGFYLSMSGIITFPKSSELRDIFSLAPIDQILVETDSPYLAPPPHRGKRNEPAYVALTAQKGAEIFDLSYEDFALQIERNFEKLFTKASSYRPAA
jgi:TatD DNase family protein